MGIHVIKMPDIGEGIAEVELVEWHVKEGDMIVEDQLLADVMTDKATVEIPSPVAGTVLKLGGTVGQTLAVGSELIRIEVAGTGNVKEALAPVGSPIIDVTNPSGSPQELGSDSNFQTPDIKRGSGSDSQTPLSGTGSSTASTVRPAASTTLTSGADSSTGATPHRSPPPVAGATAASIDAYPSRTRTAGDKPIASPAVRRQAWDLGLELQFVRGSGPAGRITHDDVDAYAASQHTNAQPPSTRSQYAVRNDEAAIPVIGLRRRIAQKMQESKRRIPHFTYVEEIDVTELEALRAKLNAKWSATRGKLTVLPLLARAMILAVREFPQINATFDDGNDGGGTVTRHGAVHLGVAAQTSAGLMVPVVRHAEAMDLWAIGAEVARLADVARSGKATREELSGSTITLTSLGALGGIVSTPVINHPEVAIVGVNRIVERPVIQSGVVVPRLMMNLSSSFDHRVVDGMHAAEFIQAIRGFLETPATLFID